MSCGDLFSRHADCYARFRPRYPESLFASLARLPARRRRAWDCGTGNGQAAIGLAACFAGVVATDASLSQLEHAPRHPRVGYIVATAERASLRAESIDLVVVAQALHWFDLSAFYDEVRRVAAPGAVLAVWCYSLCAVEPTIDTLIERFYHQAVGPFWHSERRYVDQHYQTIPFPFPELSMDRFAIELQWTCDDLLGYVTSWSATQRCRAETGEDPIAVLVPELRDAWGRASLSKTIRWSLYLRVGRVR